MVETIDLLLQRGIDPPVWKSGNSPGGDEYNQKYLDKYVGVIKHLRERRRLARVAGADRAARHAGARRRDLS